MVNFYIFFIFKSLQDFNFAFELLASQQKDASCKETVLDFRRSSVKFTELGLLPTERAVKGTERAVKGTERVVNGSEHDVKVTDLFSASN